MADYDVNSLLGIGTAPAKEAVQDYNLFIDELLDDLKAGGKL